MICSRILVHPCANSCIAGRLKPAPGRVGLLCQLLEDSNEILKQLQAHARKCAFL